MKKRAKATHPGVPVEAPAAIPPRVYGKYILGWNLFSYSLMEMI